MKNLILKSKWLRTLALTTGLVMGAFSANATVILSFDQSDLEVNINDTVTLSLFANTQTPSDGFISFVTGLMFDNNVLSFDSFALGSSFLPASPFPVTVLPGNVLGIAGAFNPLAGGPVFPPVQPSPIAFGSDLLLGTFTFTALDTGTTQVVTFGESFSGLLQFVQISSESASANVNVNTPATLAIFGLALAAMFGARRKV